MIFSVDVEGRHGGREAVERGCAYKSSIVGCNDDEYDGITTHVCTCDTNLCNDYNPPPSSAPYNYGGIVLTLTVALLSTIFIWWKNHF